MSERRLTSTIAERVFYHGGTPGEERCVFEMTEPDIRTVLQRLSKYEDACFDANGNEIISVHMLHVLRGTEEQRGTPTGARMDGDAHA